MKIRMQIILEYKIQPDWYPKGASKKKMAEMDRSIVLNECANQDTLMVSIDEIKEIKAVVVEEEEK